jgi:hypothetical protein
MPLTLGRGMGATFLAFIQLATSESGSDQLPPRPSAEKGCLTLGRPPFASIIRHQLT